MELYKQEFARLLAGSEGNPLFFGEALKLKDGRDTPYFVNIGGFSQTGEGIWQLGEFFGNRIVDILGLDRRVDIVSGPSYKASAIAQAAVMYLQRERGLNLGFNYDRKEVKAHGDGSGKGTMFVGAKFTPGCNVVIVDDVGTSMQTKIDFMDKILAETSSFDNPVSINDVVLGVDREQVGPVYRDGYDPAVHATKDWVVHGERGKDAIGEFTRETGIPVSSVLGVRELMAYLQEEGLDVPFKHADGSFTRVRVTQGFLDDHFHPYMEMYGAER